ncbi:Phosphomevalonate kinase like protein [Aduncisulcus paluster]|uniref:phosphomevalonate kinase n=1 Tax=Aduncisulcus paluster TaxID=2918883 RepID=A0ABQ5K6I0_9EUKA|nr:Phosphomevalonate kinase like protein [Aduncisulcus paluster]
MRLPGKLLLTGGYSLVYPPSYGVSLAVDDCVRIQSHHEWINNQPQIIRRDDHAKTISILINSSLFSESISVSYRLSSKQLVFKPFSSHSRFIYHSILVIIFYMWAIDAFSCSQWKYSHLNIIITIDSSGIITCSDKSISKSGLGSSGCVCVGVIKSLLTAIFPPSPPPPSLIYSLSYLASFNASGRKGSGFDVSTCVYGSHLYYSFRETYELLCLACDDISKYLTFCEDIDGETEQMITSKVKKGRDRLKGIKCQFPSQSGSIIPSSLFRQTLFKYLRICYYNSSHFRRIRVNRSINVFLVQVGEGCDTRKSLVSFHRSYSDCSNVRDSLKELTSQYRVFSPLLIQYLEKEWGSDIHGSQTSLSDGTFEKDRHLIFTLHDKIMSIQRHLGELAGISYVPSPIFSLCKHLSSRGILCFVHGAGGWESVAIVTSMSREQVSSAVHSFNSKYSIQNLHIC